METNVWVGTGNSGHAAVSRTDQEVPFLRLGAHPQVIFIDLQLLASGFVDPVLNPAWPAVRAGFREILVGKGGLEVGVVSGGVVRDVKYTVLASVVYRLLQFGQPIVAEGLREIYAKAEFGERYSGKENGRPALELTHTVANVGVTRMPSVEKSGQDTGVQYVGIHGRLR